MRRLGWRMQESCVGDGLAAAQTPIERGGAARRMDAHGNGEVELIDVAGANPLMDGLDVLRRIRCSVRAMAASGSGAILRLLASYGGAEGGQAGRITAEEGSRRMVEEIAAVVDAEPG